jgi:hypothetical protein
MSSPHYVVDSEWQTTTRARGGDVRAIDAGHTRSLPQFDTAALAAALSLNAKPVPHGAARKVAGNWGIDQS